MEPPLDARRRPRPRPGDVNVSSVEVEEAVVGALLVPPVILSVLLAKPLVLSVDPPDLDGGRPLGDQEGERGRDGRRANRQRNRVQSTPGG